MDVWEVKQLCDLINKLTSEQSAFWVGKMLSKQMFPFHQIVRNVRVIKTLDVKYPQATFWGGSGATFQPARLSQRALGKSQQKVSRGFKSRSEQSESQSSCFIWALTPPQFNLDWFCNRCPPSVWSPSKNDSARSAADGGPCCVISDAHLALNVRFQQFMRTKATINQAITWTLHHAKAPRFLPLDFQPRPGRIQTSMDRVSYLSQGKKEAWSNYVWREKLHEETDSGFGCRTELVQRSRDAITGESS